MRADREQDERERGRERERGDVPADEEHAVGLLCALADDVLRKVVVRWCQFQGRRSVASCSFMGANRNKPKY